MIHPHLGCKYYAGVDFGVSHPTAVVFVVEDQYGYMQVYKEWRKANASLSEIAQVISREDALVHLQYVVRDSASAREGLELDRLGMKTIPADKHSRGASGESNRRAGIMMLNNLFLNGRLYLSKDCPLIMRELETHRYKDSEKDGAVIKEGDDMLDALRYVITDVYKATTVAKSPNKSRFEKKYGEGLSRWKPLL